MAGFDPTCIDVEHFLNSLDVRNLTGATEEELSFSCPFPEHEGSDDKPSCYMNTHTTAFFCHGCKAKGNAVSFASHLLEVSPLEATRLLRDRYQAGAINPDERNMVKEIESIINVDDHKPEQPILDEEILERMAVDWEKVDFAIRRKQYVAEPLLYMFERGFTAECLTDWEFAYDRISDRPVFPVREQHGALIGFKGRAWREKQFPKYFVLGDKQNKEAKYGFPCYHTSMVVFGANRIPSNDGKIVICEGELNAVAVEMKTDYRAVAINGSHFSNFHAEIIKNKADEVILFLDSDPAGIAATWGWNDINGTHHDGVIDSLKNFLDVRVCPAHEGDAATMNESEIAECLGSSKNWVTLQLEV